MDESVDRCLNLLGENDTQIRENALRILLKICDNIIKHPEVAKYRRIQVANATISEKLLPASGGVECLFELGFIEDGEYFLLPSNASISRVENIEKLLRELWNKKIIFSPVNPVDRSTGTKPKIPLQPDFFQTITDAFHSVLRYEDKKLQEKTKRLIPIVKLQLAAIKSLRVMQKKIKLDNHTGNDEFLIEDLFLAELLYWFKNEFFTWVNSPTCNSCLNPCSFDRNEFVRDAKISRIEIHRCKTCGREEKFTRYTDPEILLTTRKGRCGEWANVFTLICRSLGYDARIVHDKTDHVWTEVWSIANKRWIHTDPCENAIDCPLLYEKGWKKKLSYIIAYSRDEIQDVTWRYTRMQEAVIKRRDICSENDLLMLIQRLNDERQNSPRYSEIRKRFVIKRRLMELAEFLQPPPGCKKPFDDDDGDDNKYGGRISGDTSWRLARGELSDVDEAFVWKIPSGLNVFQLRYFIVEDFYDVRDENDKVLEMKNGWNKGVEIIDGGVHRNVENDWKMVYLARSSSNTNGKIIWSVEITDDIIEIKSFELRTNCTTFNNAIVEWSIQSVNRDDSNTILTISNCELFKTIELNNARKISVIAKLSGGDGENAWQHAQLFRESISAINKCSLMITIKLN
ncbi:hypothetical protein PV327_001780 [Microctonus hyperodae]|uniref:Peptide-N(4)-(N-acetyl-beta-glucosaminyl)asparagine amidase n=1 Tax=Microctonus hyperodae TaxID=165561 RepID=A0AA39FE84_MICHY|nr:hypothetical protein PV327_001780 [Microctonus hyperodae]